METCVLFCAGMFSGLAAPLHPTDRIVAVDGGLAHVQALGLRPHEILGDFDSLGYIPENAAVFPKEKDDTDTMLALRRGLEAGYRRFVLYGALDGKRPDHAVANFQSLLFLARHGAAGYLVGKEQIVTAVHNGCVSFPAGSQGTVSLFALGGDARGVTLRGLYYPLEDGVLESSVPLGVSNHFTGQPASVRVTSGSLLILYDRKNGLSD